MSMLNMRQISSLMAATEGPMAEFSSFANFEERRRKSNLLMSFPKIVHQKGEKKSRWLPRVFMRLNSARYHCLPGVSINHVCENDAITLRRNENHSGT